MPTIVPTPAGNNVNVSNATPGVRTAINVSDKEKAEEQLNKQNPQQNAGVIPAPDKSLQADTPVGQGSFSPATKLTSVEDGTDLSPDPVVADPSNTTVLGMASTADLERSNLMVSSAKSSANQLYRQESDKSITLSKKMTHFRSGYEHSRIPLPNNLDAKFSRHFYSTTDEDEIKILRATAKSSNNLVVEFKPGDERLYPEVKFVD